MRTLFVAALLLLSMTLVAQAENKPNPFRFTLGVGINWGGDPLVTANFSDGSTRSASLVNDLFALEIGGDYRFNKTLSLKSTIGYHTSSLDASNGHLKITSIPVEVLGCLNLGPKLRVGAGKRFVRNAKSEGSGFFSDCSFDFDNTTGTVFEMEYFYMPAFSTTLRYVTSEEYRATGAIGSVSGEHYGAYMNLYF